MRQFVKGQGAQTNPANRFDSQRYEDEASYLNYLLEEGEEDKVKTKLIEVFPKTIVNKVPSPDVPMDWSLNPYQGCEHGCSYCYARPTHEFWGYSAGIDFERTILYKKNAPALLDATLKQKSWTAKPIMLSGNTDCYQPVEAKLKLTRQLLEVFWQHKHPVGIITKNALLLRDTDILAKLASENLVHVVYSVTTLDEELRRAMEPRTSSAKKRLEAIRTLSALNIPVSVMMAPIVPGLNSHEIFDVLKAVKAAGARDAHYTLARLNGPVGEVFVNWLHQTFPDRAFKVLNQIADSHNGKLSDSKFRHRMRGSGKVADNIASAFSLARMRTFGSPGKLSLNTSLHLETKQPQLKLF